MYVCMYVCIKRQQQEGHDSRPQREPDPKNTSIIKLPRRTPAPPWKRRPLTLLKIPAYYSRLPSATCFIETAVSSARKVHCWVLTPCLTLYFSLLVATNVLAQ